MKKIIALTLALLLASMLLFGCAPEAGNDDVTTDKPEVSDTGDNGDNPTVKDDTVIRVAGLNGPTTMGIVKLMEDSANGTAANNYSFTVATGADEITPLLTKGELDVALIPANLASNLYAKTNGAIQVMAINTLGVIYVVENGNTVNSLADLKGKTVYAPSTLKGAAPELAFRYVLSQNGIDPDNDITVEWKSEPTEVVATLKKSGSGIALLPQPFATVAASSIEGLRTVVDVNSAWNDLNTGCDFITGVTVVRREFAQAHPELIASFLEEYETSVAYVNANVEDAALLVEKNNIVKSAVAKVAIPKCNITFVSGAEMKTRVSGFLSILYEMKPASVGGALPADDFYYAG